MKNYNPWQERFDAVCRKIDEQSKLIQAKRKINNDNNNNNSIATACNTCGNVENN